MKSDTYVSSPPGDCPAADAVNLVIASLSGNDLMAEAIVNHQPADCHVPILGTVCAMLVMLLRDCMPAALTEHYLEHFVKAAQVQADELQSSYM
jgi:hypothetical protein